MLEILPFSAGFCDEAKALVAANYAEACARLPLLPAHASLPDLTYFAENDMGVVALHGGRMVGFLSAFAPIDGFFGPVRGTYSPLHAHAAVSENRHGIYARLYQAAAERWMRQQVTSHAVVLYARDEEAVHSFFFGGFGMRTVDAVRRVEPLQPAPTVAVDGIRYSELAPEDFSRILPLHNGLTAHGRTSPLYMPWQDYTLEQLLAGFERKQSRLFGAWRNDQVIAYIEVMDAGENFITLVPEMPNICGAYMLPAYRGSGIYAALLDFLLLVLGQEGYTHLGVDFESFNPTAAGFWLKHFAAYTYGATRRIDERVVTA